MTGSEAMAVEFAEQARQATVFAEIRRCRSIDLTKPFSRQEKGFKGAQVHP
jgi:hypothetical protein